MKSKFIPITTIIDERGSLSFTQNNLLPFLIKRIFYLTNLSTIRGGHSHYKSEQILYCINGKCSLYCDDGNEKLKCDIDNDIGGLYIPANHWVEISNFSENCVILVLCSDNFDEKDYCRDKVEFIRYVNELKNQIIPIKLNNVIKNIEPLKNQLLDKYNEILSNGQFINGNETMEFEEKFSKYMNLKYTVTCCNGTAALFLALKSLNLPDDSEILIQTNTYIAGIISICSSNLKVKWVEIDENTLTIDVNKIEENITSKTKVLLLVHLYGMCTNMDEIVRIKEKHNLFLIEDCAQAHGAMWNNKKLGTFGDIACFSFYPSKNLGAVGEAGCISTNNIEYKNRISCLKQFGQQGVYNYIYSGFNLKSSNLIIASINLKLEYLDEYNNKRNMIAKLYKKYLNKEKIILLKEDERNYINYHLFVIIVENRDKLIEYLKENKIESGIHYPNPIYLTEPYKHLECKYDKFTNLSTKIISLPIYPELTEEEVIYICSKINSFMKL